MALPLFFRSPKLSISGLLDNVERAKKKMLDLLEDLGEAVIVAQHCVWKMENVSGSLENFPLRVSRVIVSHYEVRSHFCLFSND